MKMNKFKNWTVAAAILAVSFSASEVHAGGIKEIHGFESSWENVVIPQMLSIFNRGRHWTPTEFAIARGDIGSVSNTRRTKDVIIKSGVASNLLLKILPWIKDTRNSRPND
jgi:hypothetical protein